MALGPKQMPSGAVLQSGLSTQVATTRQAGGLLLRGVVIATYTVDDPNHPAANPAAQASSGVPAAIYCDVMVYSVMMGYQRTFYSQVLVGHDTGAMHQGGIWRPRAATKTYSGATLDFNTINPSDCDGDHVLIGFIDNSLTTPIILGGLPHPFSDAGQSSTNIAPLKQTMRLHGTQSDPRLWKHHGTTFGVTSGGDFAVNTTYANDGTLQAKCKEPPPPTDGTLGNLQILLQQHAERLTRLIDMSQPGTPQDVAREILTSTSYTLSFLDGTGTLASALAIDGAASDAIATVGDGAVHAAVVEELYSLYKALKLQFDTHFHNTSIGPSATALASGFAAPAWHGALYGAHLAFPATQASEVPAAYPGV